MSPSEPGGGDGGTFIPDDSTPTPNASTGILERYLYDAGGLRVLTAGANGGVTSQYTKSGQLVRRLDQATNKETEYVYLAGSQLAQRERAGTSAWAVKYQHTDALGSPVAVTDANRVVLDRTEWEPYGAAVNKPAYDGVGYTGHVMDGATGLTYMQQRYYDPDIGRFLSVDPVTANSGTGANFNRYWYANNSPYKFTDPDGRQAHGPNGSWERPDNSSAPAPSPSMLGDLTAMADPDDSRTLSEGLWATVRMAIAFSPAGLEGRAAKAVGEAGQALRAVRSSSRSAVSLAKPATYGPFHRLGDSADAIQGIRNSGELRGNKPRNFFQSDIPKVQAYEGALPAGAKGFEFTTPVAPDAGHVPGKPTWNPSTPGVTEKNGQAIIPCKVTRC